MYLNSHPQPYIIDDVDAHKKRSMWWIFWRKIITLGWKAFLGEVSRWEWCNSRVFISFTCLLWGSCCFTQSLDFITSSPILYPPSNLFYHSLDDSYYPEIDVHWVYSQPIESCIYTNIFYFSSFFCGYSFFFDFPFYRSCRVLELINFTTSFYIF